MEPPPRPPGQGVTPGGLWWRIGSLAAVLALASLAARALVWALPVAGLLLASSVLLPPLRELLGTQPVPPTPGCSRR